MRYLTLLILCCLSGWTLHAQPLSQEEKAQKFVHQVDPLGLVIIETISPGMTFYSLKKKYQISLETLYQANPDLEPSFIPLGHPIQIPIDTGAITLSQPVDTANSFPVFYRVQPGETLYRIAKVYLGVSPSNLLQLNPRIDEGLSIGQVIHLGWYAPEAKTNLPVKEVSEAGPSQIILAVPDSMTTQTPDSLLLSASDTLDARNMDSLTTFKITNFEAMYIAEGKEIREEKGLAVWKPGSDQSNFYVLHPTARVGSYMEITNPMLQRTLTAKVAGNLASGIYPSHVALIVSPSIARALGVLDQQFFARWRFVE